MNRVYWGIGILLTLLLLSSGIWWGMDRIHKDIWVLLQQAQTAAEAEDWQSAGEYARQADARWQRYHHVTAAFADHTPMDELDGLFAELTVFGENQESPHFEATCARLILLTQAMADNHGIPWWNVL